MDAPADLGLFPLPVVLLPGEAMPLHIFEPRYRRLVADCVLEDVPFVLVLSTDEGVARVGCAARVESLVRRFADGRMNVVVRGVERVEILEQSSGRMYLSALVRPLGDEPGGGVPDAALEEEVLALYRDLVAQVAGAAADPQVREGVPLSFAVAATFEAPPEVRQDLLQRRDEESRLVILRDLLTQARGRADRASIAAARARTNGKVSHG
ncbi:MAG: LON peptidase substrate-binding domain-containing protein [Actinomycetota bacterium]